MSKILKLSGGVLFSDDKLSTKELVEKNKYKLKYADLRDTELSNASLRYADLRGTDLTNASLSNADLTNADLTNTNLTNTNLRYVDLRNASLSNADLTNADLTNTNLRYVDLRNTDLTNTDLRGTVLSNANLRSANLIGSKRHSLELKHFNRWDNLYEYDVEAIVGECGTTKIKMGCFTKTLEEWEKDFWNNDDEFPDDNSELSQLRLFAFETAKRWVEIKLEGDV